MCAFLNSCSLIESQQNVIGYANMGRMRLAGHIYREGHLLPFGEERRCFYSGLECSGAPPLSVTSGLCATRNGTARVGGVMAYIKLLFIFPLYVPCSPPFFKKEPCRCNCKIFILMREPRAWENPPGKSSYF